jgi:hypothetical protein
LAPLREAVDFAHPDFPGGHRMSEPREYLNRDDWAVLASISDQEFHSDQAGLGLYTIPACPPGEPCARLTIYGRTELYDMGDDRRGERYWPARVIARSVLAEHNPDADLRRYGVFLCSGDAPLDAELREAAARRDAFFRQQVEQADALFARAPNRPELISDLQRRAAHLLGLSPAWSKLRPVQECPACGEPVKVGVAICRHCGAVLDEAKAVRYSVPVRSAAIVAHAAQPPVELVPTDRP